MQRGKKLLDDVVLLERARASGRSLMEETALALEAGEMPARYQRNADSLSLNDQARLARFDRAARRLRRPWWPRAGKSSAHGRGARILVCDQNRFEISDCNRQTLAVRDTLGTPKALVCSKRAQTVNPLVEVQALCGVRML